MSDGVQIDVRKLKKLIRAFGTDIPQGKVGVLGNGKRQSGKTTNAEVAAAHEYGTETIPRRSFLREPINEQLPKKLEEQGLGKDESIQRIIAEQSLLEWVKRLTLMSESIVLEAFATAGFGKWKPSNMKGKKVQQTLVETGQLRDSISSEVK